MSCSWIVFVALLNTMLPNCIYHLVQLRFSFVSHYVSLESQYWELFNKDLLKVSLFLMLQKEECT
jgi:hypothetical protein